jgi:hypothetical protein
MDKKMIGARQRSSQPPRVARNCSAHTCHATLRASLLAPRARFCFVSQR